MARFVATVRALFLPPVPDHLADRLAIRQFKRVREFVPVLYLTIAVISLAAGVAAHDNLPWIFQSVLPAGFILLSAVRMVMWRKHQQVDVTAQQAKRALRSVFWSSLPLSMFGALMAVLGFFLATGESRALPPMFITFAAFACANCLSSFPKAAMTTLVITMVPTMVVMIIWGDTSVGAIAITMAVVSLLQFRFILSTFREMLHNLHLQHDMQTLAETDHLTGLSNRRAFTSQLEAALKVDEDGGNFAITMIDLDGFKPANDRYGHAAGDAILVEVAGRLRTLCANETSVARIGGDEFAVILAPSHDRITHAERATAIQSILSMPYAIDGDLIHITASVGLACHPVDGHTITALLKSADCALYAQKNRYYGIDEAVDDDDADRQIGLFA